MNFKNKTIIEIFDFACTSLNYSPHRYSTSEKVNEIASAVNQYYDILLGKGLHSIFIEEQIFSVSIDTDYPLNLGSDVYSIDSIYGIPNGINSNPIKFNSSIFNRKESNTYYLQGNSLLINSKYSSVLVKFVVRKDFDKDNTLLFPFTSDIPFFLLLLKRQIVYKFRNLEMINLFDIQYNIELKNVVEKWTSYDSGSYVRLNI